MPRTAGALLLALLAPASGLTAQVQDCPAAEEMPMLVVLADSIADLREDIRYATKDNFTGEPLPGYEVGAALLRPSAAAALAGVQVRLGEEGLGLLVWDAYRPVRATLAMVEWAERTGNEWVLDEGYVARRSNHNRGNTIDLTVVSLESGEPLDMGTEYDHFGPESHTATASGEVQRNRTLLLDAMEVEGWENYPQEWWHFTWTGDGGAGDLGGGGEPAEPDFIDVPIGCWVDSGPRARVP